MMKSRESLNYLPTGCLPACLHLYLPLLSSKVEGEEEHDDDDDDVSPLERVRMKCAGGNETRNHYCVNCERNSHYIIFAVLFAFCGKEWSGF
jgi:hypothetical protein